MRRFLMLLVLMPIAIAHHINAQPTFNTESQKQFALSNISSMPLAFTENRGQWDEKALFKAEAGGATFWFCRDEVVYQFMRDTDELIEDANPHSPEMPEGIPDKFNNPRYKKESMVLRVQFVGANPDAEIIATDRLSHNNNYFIGNIPSKWATNVPNYSSITYKDIYPGIDLTYHGDGKGMKYDFIVNPGADISLIKIKYEGVEGLDITSNGDLQADTRFGPVYERIPQIYQEIDGQKRYVSGHYFLQASGIFGFALEDGFNPAYPVVIDPELVYSTYLGGSNNDYGYGIAVDDSGQAYVTGRTSSSDFPTVNPYDGSFNGSADVFVAKLSSAGNSLLYSTYLGGSHEDDVSGIAVDGSGQAYVTGYTYSSDFPTVNPYDGSFNGSADVFVAKLSSAGNSLLYSTYLGGSDYDYSYGIAVDGSGQVYVTGSTYSSDFPTVNPYDGFNWGGDVFVAKLSSAGNSLLYSTYLGGSDYDYGEAIAVDGSGQAYVTGLTYSSDFPTVNPYDGSFNGNYDVFVAKLSSAGNFLLYSTYLGGSNSDWGYGIAVDGSGQAYVTGETWSSDFPTVNPYDWSLNGITDVFVAKLSSAGNSLLYSTYLGGSNDDWGCGIAVDGSGQAYVTGYTYSSDFPTVNPYDVSLNGNTDVFVTKLGAGGPPPIGTVTGTVMETDGAIPIEGVPIGALHGGITVARDTTGPDGRYFLPEMQLGLYDIVASKDGYIPNTLLNIEVTANDTAYANFQLEQVAPPCQYIPGDANNSGTWTGQDVTYSVRFFKGGTPPPYSCECTPGHTWYVAGDVNGSCSFTGQDVTYMVRHFKGGPTAIPCPDCPPAP